MILVDANLLLYAYRPRASEHEASREWLESVLSGSEFVRFAWVTPWAFMRIATNPRVFEHPLSAAEAANAVSSWLEQPGARGRQRYASGGLFTAPPGADATPDATRGPCRVL